MKCEVLKDSVLHIQKGSIVLVSERQYELARRVLKPINEAKAEAEAEVKAEEEEPKKAKKKAKETE